MPLRRVPRRRRRRRRETSGAIRQAVLLSTLPQPSAYVTCPNAAVAFRSSARIATMLGDSLPLVVLLGSKLLRSSLPLADTAGVRRCDEVGLAQDQPQQ